MRPRNKPEPVECVGCGQVIDKLRLNGKTNYFEPGQNLTHRCEGKPEMECQHCGKPIRFRVSEDRRRLEPCDPDGLEHDCVLSKKAASLYSRVRKSTKHKTDQDQGDWWREFRYGSAATKPTPEKHKEDRRRGARLPGSK